MLNLDQSMRKDSRQESYLVAADLRVREQEIFNKSALNLPETGQLDVNLRVDCNKSHKNVSSLTDQSKNKTPDFKKMMTKGGPQQFPTHCVSVFKLSPPNPKS